MNSRPTYREFLTEVIKDCEREGDETGRKIMQEMWQELEELERLDSPSLFRRTPKGEIAPVDFPIEEPKPMS